MNLNQKKNLDLLREEINAALAAVGAKHGVTLTAGSCRYEADGGSATFKLGVARVNADGTVDSPERTAFLMNADLYGLKASDLGAVFAMGGHRYEVTGLATRRSKKPVIIRETDSGKTYVIAAEAVKRHLTAQGVGAAAVRS